MPRTITLKYDGTCRDCGAELLAGTIARYYGRGRIYGTECHEDTRPDPRRARPDPALDAEHVIAAARESMFGLGSEGICRACGESQDGVEPDASGYECEACGAHAVCGAEDLLFEL
jgi:hypothetical protein